MKIKQDLTTFGRLKRKRCKVIFIRFINSYLPFNSLPTHTWQSGLCFCIQRKRSRDQAGTRHQYKKLMIFGYDKNCMKRSSKNKLFTNSNKSDMFYSLLLDWMQSFVGGGWKKWLGEVFKGKGNWLIDWLKDQSLFNKSINWMEDLEDSDYAFIFLISALKELKIKVFSLFWKYCSLHNFSMFGRDRSLLLLIRSWGR